MPHVRHNQTGRDRHIVVHLERQRAHPQVVDRGLGVGDDGPAGLLRNARPVVIGDVTEALGETVSSVRQRELEADAINDVAEGDFVQSSDRGVDRVAPTVPRYRRNWLNIKTGVGWIAGGLPIPAFLIECGSPTRSKAPADVPPGPLRLPGRLLGRCRDEGANEDVSEDECDGPNPHPVIVMHHSIPLDSRGPARPPVLAPFAVDRSAAPLQSWGTRGVSPAGTLEP